MAITDSTPRVPFGAITVHRVVSGVTGLADRFARWREISRTVRILSDLDDDQLVDLGLSREDITQIARRGQF